MKTKEYKIISDILDKNVELCPWIESQTVEKFIKELHSEVEELKDAFKNDDEENMKEEMADILLDVLNMIRVAERDGLITGKEVAERIEKKLRKRKPFIFEGRKVSLEEAMNIWREAKKDEKL